MKMVSRRILAVFSVMVVIIWNMAGLFMANVSAADNDGTLTVCYKNEETILSGMQCQIYRVGHRENNDYVFDGAFANYRLTFGDMDKPMKEWDSETIGTLAATLRVYAVTDKLPNDGEGVTDENGNITFTGLEDGLYLVCGNNLKIEEYTYKPSAVFFEMRGEENANLVAFPKIVLRTLSEKVSNYSVRKEWANDEEQPWNRSTSVSVELFCDGELYETVELSDKNNWRYSWQDTPEHEWSVREKDIPENYTVGYQEKETWYIIVNTYNEPSDVKHDTDDTHINTTAITDDSYTVVQTTTSISGTISGGNEINNSGQSSSKVSKTDSAVMSSDKNEQTKTTTATADKLPQTGQLWWPVMPLSCGGILMIGMGLRLMKKENEE